MKRTCIVCAGGTNRQWTSLALGEDDLWVCDGCEALQSAIRKAAKNSGKKARTKNKGTQTNAGKSKYASFVELYKMVMASEDVDGLVRVLRDMKEQKEKEREEIEIASTMQGPTRSCTICGAKDGEFIPHPCHTALVICSSRCSGLWAILRKTRADLEEHVREGNLEAWNNTMRTEVEALGRRVEERKNRPVSDACPVCQRTGQACDLCKSGFGHKNVSLYDMRKDADGRSFGGDTVFPYGSMVQCCLCMDQFEVQKGGGAKMRTLESVMTLLGEPKPDNNPGLVCDACRLTLVAGNVPVPINTPCRICTFAQDPTKTMAVFLALGVDMTMNHWLGKVPLPSGLGRGVEMAVYNICIRGEMIPYCRACSMTRKRMMMMMDVPHASGRENYYGYYQLQRINDVAGCLEDVLRLRLDEWKPQIQALWDRHNNDSIMARINAALPFAKESVESIDLSIAILSEARVLDGDLKGTRMDGVLAVVPTVVLERLRMAALQCSELLYIQDTDMRHALRYWCVHPRETSDEWRLLLRHFIVLGAFEIQSGYGYRCDPNTPDRRIGVDCKKLISSPEWEEFGARQLRHSGAVAAHFYNLCEKLKAFGPNAMYMERMSCTGEHRARDLEDIRGWIGTTIGRALNDPPQTRFRKYAGTTLAVNVAL